MDEEELENQKKNQEQKKILEAKKAEEQLKMALRVALETNAYDRMSNVQHANEQLFLIAARHIITFYKRAGRKLKDEEVLAILNRIKELNEKETKIRFERK